MRGRSIFLDIKFPRSDYPYKAPIVRFETKIFHFNVNDKGQICGTIFKNLWYSSMGIRNILLSLYDCLQRKQPGPRCDPCSGPTYKKRIYLPKEDVIKIVENWVRTTGSWPNPLTLEICKYGSEITVIRKSHILAGELAKKDYATYSKIAQEWTCKYAQ